MAIPRSAKDQFDLAQTEAENVIQPYSGADDFGRKAMAVTWIGWFMPAVCSGIHPCAQAGSP
jgi:hypothetical protein